MLPIWQKAKELGVKTIPSRIANHSGYLPWHDSWNRDFLRAYFSVGINHFEKENYDHAYWIFSHILELSPNDNQGARYLAVDSCFGLGRHVKVLEICERYNTADVIEPYLNFSNALAMFSTYEIESIKDYLKESITEFPIFAKLLSQKRKPNLYDSSHFSSPGYLSGEKEEAKYYWNQQGKFWNQNPDALKLVRALYKDFKNK